MDPSPGSPRKCTSAGFCSIHIDLVHIWVWVGLDLHREAILFAQCILQDTKYLRVLLLSSLCTSSSGSSWSYLIGEVPGASDTCSKWNKTWATVAQTAGFFPLHALPLSLSCTCLVYFSFYLSTY